MHLIAIVLRVQIMVFSLLAECNAKRSCKWSFFLRLIGNQFSRSEACFVPTPSMWRESPVKTEVPVVLPLLYRWSNRQLNLIWGALISVLSGCFIAFKRLFQKRKQTVALQIVDRVVKRLMAMSCYGKVPFTEKIIIWRAFWPFRDAYGSAFFERICGKDVEKYSNFRTNWPMEVSMLLRSYLSAVR